MRQPEYDQGVVRVSGDTGTFSALVVEAQFIRVAKDQILATKASKQP